GYEQQPVYTNSEYTITVDGYEGYAVAADFYTYDTNIDSNWYSYDAVSGPEYTTVAAGSQQSTGSPDSSWSNGYYVAGYQDDDPHQPIYTNNAYEGPTGNYVTIGYHVTAVKITPTFSETLDPSWVAYGAATGPHTVAAGTYHNVGSADPAWTN